MSSKIRLLGVFAIVCSGAVVAVDVMACSCAPRTLEQRYESSPNVFTAFITEEYLEPSDGRTPIRSLFSVTESFKGEPPFATFVTENHTSCGIDLQEGVEYLFFAPDSGEIGFCSGFSSTEASEPEIAALRSYVSGESSRLAEPWRFFEYRSGECSLRTLFDFGNGFGQGRLSISASNERAAWGRIDPRFDFVELTVHLMHSFPVALDARSPLKLRVGNTEYPAEWTTGRSFNQVTRDGRTVKVPWPDSYSMLGTDVEELLSRLAVADDLLVRFDGQGFEPDSEVLVRTENLTNAAPEMQKCMSSLRAAQSETEIEVPPAVDASVETIENTLTDDDSIERLLQEYRRVFAKDRLDPEWSDSMEARILAEISQMQTVGLAATFIEVECRATLCRVAITFPSPTSQAPERRVLGPDIGWGTELALAKQVGLEDKHDFWTVSLPGQVEFLTYLRRP